MEKNKTKIRKESRTNALKNLEKLKKRQRRVIKNYIKQKEI